jgi:hypothetical protein
MNTQHTPNNAKQVIETAMGMVTALCLPRGTEGARNWIMSIPARPDYDPDLVIARGLTAAEKEIDRLEQQCEELLAALIEHQELTRPIQRSIDAIAKAQGDKT